MTLEQVYLLILLVAVFTLFAWGRLRYDVVAFLALLAVAVPGLVPVGEVFAGFGHPATVTVAMVLILSRALVNSGAVDLLARHLLPPVRTTSGHVGLLAALVGALSTVMNNVGALALLMPAAIQSAEKARRPASVILMPLAFASLLGGLVTLIGTPPNIIIATFRKDLSGTAFAMFDFAPVGAAVAVVGIAFVALLGWRLIPRERQGRLSPHELFDIERYVSEAHVPKDSSAVGMSLRDLDDRAAAHDATILGLIRRGRRIDPANRRVRILADDLLVIEVAPERLNRALAALQLDLPGKQEGEKRSILGGEDVALAEAIVQPRSPIAGRTGAEIRLRQAYGVNLLAVSRQGAPHVGPLRSFRFRPGDILLLEGDPDRLPAVIARLGCLPLARREIPPGKNHMAEIAIAILAAAILAAAVGVLGFTVALALAAAAVVVLNIVPPRDLYDAVDWSIIVLLGAMIPVGRALEGTGTTALIAETLIDLTAGAPPAAALLVVMVVTIAMTNVINNAATAVVMAPVAADAAAGLGVSEDPFLMAVAVAASAAFLTPIGHQNNTLVMGPGGYRFADYWRMGLPLEIIVVAVALPMLLWVWPL